MKHEMTCIICPNGCELSVETLALPDGSETVLFVTGNTCRNGEHYARQEVERPQRNIATSVAVTGGKLPLASVRLTRPIDKHRIPEVAAAIRQVTLAAPVAAGTVLIENVLGTGADVIATRSVPAAEGALK